MYEWRMYWVILGDEREDVDCGKDVVCGVVSTCVVPLFTVTLVRM